MPKDISNDVATAPTIKYPSSLLMWTGFNSLSTIISILLSYSLLLSLGVSPNVPHPAGWGNGVQYSVGTRSRRCLEPDGSATAISLLFANLRGEEVAVCVSTVRRKKSAPYLTSSRINDEAMIPGARHLITPHWAGGRCRSNAEGDENADAQPNQCTLEFYFGVHKTV